MTETSDHEHSHQHSAGHEHPTKPDQDDSITYFKAMEAAVRDPVSYTHLTLPTSHCV